MTSGTLLLCTVNAKVCSEELGQCDQSCNSKCIAKHPDGKGSCDVTAPATPCVCYFECNTPSPPIQKICNAGIGPCSEKCNDICCNENCAAKFAGREGHGTCFNPVGAPIYNYCLCLFNC
ncbi:hypothetical protein ACOSP7_015719 [Xanthoceras sorbifolium]